ncbi:MAG: hypothetical protein R3A48_03735 [Polyangiales bacterium]
MFVAGSITGPPSTPVVPVMFPQGCVERGTGVPRPVRQSSAPVAASTA